MPVTRKLLEMIGFCPHTPTHTRMHEYICMYVGIFICVYAYMCVYILMCIIYEGMYIYKCKYKM